MALICFAFGGDSRVMVMVIVIAALTCFACGPSCILYDFRVIMIVALTCLICMWADRWNIVILSGVFFSGFLKIFFIFHFYFFGKGNQREGWRRV